MRARQAGSPTKTPPGIKERKRELQCHLFSGGSFWRAAARKERIPRERHKEADRGGRPPFGEWGVEEESFFRAESSSALAPPWGGGGGETGGGRAKKIHRRRVRKEEMEAWDMALGDRRHGCPYRNGSQFFEIHSGLGTVAGRASGGERNPQGRETLSFFVIVLRCASVGVMRSGYIDRTYRGMFRRGSTSCFRSTILDPKLHCPFWRILWIRWSRVYIWGNWGDM